MRTKKSRLKVRPKAKMETNELKDGRTGPTALPCPPKWSVKVAYCNKVDAYLLYRPTLTETPTSGKIAFSGYCSRLVETVTVWRN